MSLTPDQVIAKANFSEFQSLNYPSLSEDDAFERFAGGLATKLYGISLPDAEKGLVGATNDGGIDALYIFLNGQEPVTSDSIRLTKRRNALDGIRSGVALDILVVQAKNETTWDTNVFPKIQSALELILKANVTAAELRAFPFNDDVVEKALMLRDLRTRLAPFVPVMRFTVQYVTFAAQSNAVADLYMETKRAQLEEFLQGKLPTGSEVVVEYVGDSEIVTRLRVSNDFTAELVLEKHAVRVNNALVGVVTIANYLKFLRMSGSNVIREELFAVNVRDYAGEKVRVNKAIAETLATDTATEFWWLNNGITILADHASDPVELHWVATNPLIVNGLQTSHVIHEQDLANKITDLRMSQPVLVRLIIESDPDVREAIIRGTNNQTAIASIQLHANDEQQIRIEEYLRHAKWFYERRRYQYRSTAVSASRTRTITDVAQAVMAFRLLEPDTARARPGTLLNSTAGWARVFNENESEELYLKALNVAEAVDKYLRSPAASLIPEDATNSRHYLMAGYALRSSGVKDRTSFDSIPTRQLKSAPKSGELNALHKLLHLHASKLDDGKTARDRIFKGAKLRPAYFDAIFKVNGRI
ncbi:MAG: AIPR family protein [Salinibacterium sp.]|nr:AIPR family protein [Salinibacterium sp.]MBF0671001.1 AIPR family protein [Salinibacterium sp.]